MSKKSLTLALICFLGSIVACDQLPEFPTVEVKLVDAQREKLHRYHLPKKRGEKAPYLGAVPASLGAIEKNFCIAPREYAKLEEYISDVEDLALRRCR